MHSDDLRWRIVTLIHVYDIDPHFLSDLFGPNPRSIQRWYQMFLNAGTVRHNLPAMRASRWPAEVVLAVEEHVKGHPTFCIEELKCFIQQEFTNLRNVSESTTCRVLNFDLQLTRKKLTKAAREAAPEEIENYFNKLRPIYSFPEQLVFIDETSKDGRDAFRRCARSKRGTKAVVKLPFSRGNRVSVFAALDYTGFMSGKCTSGTFSRKRFHHAFSEKVVPFLNPWPLPRSIVVMDNAKIHMFKELEDAVHQCGARIVFLPPHSPELNPIEVCFGQLKRWIQKHANLVFPLHPEMVLEVAMPACTKDIDHGTLGLYGHCGYDNGGLRVNFFEDLQSNRTE